MSVSRRSFLASTPLLFAPAVLQRPAVSATFPTQPADLARQMVGASHRDGAKVRELLALHPTLANASWDWGFGDWEDAIGAASHVGNREIAAILLAHGARPTIFTAAMLGQLDTVKAFIKASPGIEATTGPHGITLLRHAIAGGPTAQPVVDYLKTVPDADKRPDSQPLSPEAMAALAGEYLFGPGADERPEPCARGRSRVLSGRGPAGSNPIPGNTWWPHPVCPRSRSGTGGNAGTVALRDAICGV